MGGTAWRGEYRQHTADDLGCRHGTSEASGCGDGRQSAGSYFKKFPRRRIWLLCRAESDRIMSELRYLTLADMRDGLKAKKFSAVELAEAHLAEIENTHGHY